MELPLCIAGSGTIRSATTPKLLQVWAQGVSVDRNFQIPFSGKPLLTKLPKLVRTNADTALSHEWQQAVKRDPALTKTEKGGTKSNKKGARRPEPRPRHRRQGQDKGDAGGERVRTDLVSGQSLLSTRSPIDWYPGSPGLTKRPRWAANRNQVSQKRNL